MYHDYVRYERFPPGASVILPWLATPLRVWDFAAAQRPDYFVAGSHNARRRIAKYYRRDSDVVHSPIDASAFRIADRVGDYFLVVSRLQSYKRIDLAVTACTRLGLPLHVVGDGPDRARLQSLAGPTIRFLGRLSDGEVQDQMSRCRAHIVPGEEDFGLTPLEVQASGRPVIAYARGGALETVLDGHTGVFFREQTAECLAGVLASLRDDFDPQALRRHAMSFDRPVFKRRMYELLARRVTEHRRCPDDEPA
jgi:glycosyltransferase involved in cell wall biosynthesis